MHFQLEIAYAFTIHLLLWFLFDFFFAIIQIDCQQLFRFEFIRSYTHLFIKYFLIRSNYHQNTRKILNGKKIR